MRIPSVLRWKRCQAVWADSESRVWVRLSVLGRHLRFRYRRLLKKHLHTSQSGLLQCELWLCLQPKTSFATWWRKSLWRDTHASRRCSIHGEIVKILIICKKYTHTHSLRTRFVLSWSWCKFALNWNESPFNNIVHYMFRIFINWSFLGFGLLFLIISQTTHEKAPWFSVYHHKPSQGQSIKPSQKLESVQLMRQMVRQTEPHGKSFLDTVRKCLAGDSTNHLSIIVYHRLTSANQIHRSTSGVQPREEHRHVFLQWKPSMSFFAPLSVK